MPRNLCYVPNALLAYIIYRTPYNILYRLLFNCWRNFPCSSKVVCIIMMSFSTSRGFILEISVSASRSHIILICLYRGFAKLVYFIEFTNWVFLFRHRYCCFHLYIFLFCPGLFLFNLYFQVIYQYPLHCLSKKMT